MTPALAGEMGNVHNYLARTKLGTSGTVSDLTKWFDTSSYLTGSSDAVALLVLSHQTYVHNLITAAGYQARVASDDRMRIEAAAERLVKGLLFANQASLPDPIAGNTSFATEFAKAGPRDRQGRSLRDLQLADRVFRYPLSFLIYSESFDALPPPVKEYVYRRLHEVLEERESKPQFPELSHDDRRAILQILADTKPEFGRETTAAADR